MSNASPAFVEPLITGSPASPGRQRFARQSGLVEHADTLGHGAINRNHISPSYKEPFAGRDDVDGYLLKFAPRYRKLVRGMRASKAIISRRARFRKALQILSARVHQRHNPAARCSPTASAALIERAAMTSNPTSPRRRLVTISTSNASNTGNVTAAHTAAAATSRPATFAAMPASKPSRGETGEVGPGNLERCDSVHALTFDQTGHRPP